MKSVLPSDRNTIIRESSFDICLGSSDKHKQKQILECQNRVVNIETHSPLG